MSAVEQVQVSPQVGRGGGQEQVGFDCERWRLTRIVLVNLLLSIVTMGIYRFWARTRLRREFWSMLSFRGDRLEYTGTGFELFVGFLIAMVALVPLFVVLQIANMLIPPSQYMLLLGVNMVIFLIMAVLGIFGLYFARRYLLTRTRWRGITAGQDGTAGDFFLLHLKAYGAVLLTLGAAYPWADVRTFNYRMGITRFGTGQFGADTTTRGLWGPWIVAIAVLWTFYIAFFSLWIPFMAFLGELDAAQKAGLPAPAAPSLPTWPLFAIPVLLLGWFFAWAHYNVTRLRLFASAVRFGTMRLGSDLRTREMLPLLGLYVLLVIVSLLVAGGAGFVVGQAGGPFRILAPIMGILAFFAAYSVLTIVWLRVEALRMVAASLTVDGPDALEEVVNRGAVAPRRGEGLADALGDVGLTI